MSYYCEITDLTDTVPGMLMTHFDVKRESDDSVVVPNVTRQFHITITDEDGNPISETVQQKETRYWSELQVYADRLLADMTLVDTYYEGFRQQVVGVRYPAAQE